MLDAVLDRKRARNRGYSAARLDSQLAQDLDASPAAIERVRSEVQIEAVLLFGLRTAPERVRLLKQANGPGTPGDQNRCCKPGHTASNDNYIALIFI